MKLQPPCPCGSAVTYDACCGAFHRGGWPPSALLLMRARYAAYAKGDADFVFRTWHPRTRPADITLDPSLRWTGLAISGHGEDWVSFAASYLTPAGSGTLVERSHFAPRAGRLMYVDGEPG